MGGVYEADAGRHCAWCDNDLRCSVDNSTYRGSRFVPGPTSPRPTCAVTAPTRPRDGAAGFSYRRLWFASDGAAGRTPHGATGWLHGPAPRRGNARGVTPLSTWRDAGLGAKDTPPSGAGAGRRRRRARPGRSPMPARASVDGSGHATARSRSALKWGKTWGKTWDSGLTWPDPARVPPPGPSTGTSHPRP